jgi:hypothetical protein
VGPAKRWAWRQTADDELMQFLEPKFAQTKLTGETQPAPSLDRGWQAKAVSIFECGYCLTPWLAGAALIAEVTIARVPVVGSVYRWLMATLATSYIAGHIWNRLDH